MAEQKKAGLRPAPIAAVAAAIALATPIAMQFEGLRTKPYRDPVGIPTVCYGETQRPMRTYTADECAILLEQRQARDYAPAVLRCVPGLAESRRSAAFAASIDFAYNAGTGSFCRSSMARAFNSGRFAEGCRAFGLYTKARLNGRLTVLPGLVRRRTAETSLCLKGA